MRSREFTLKNKRNFKYLVILLISLFIFFIVYRVPNNKIIISIILILLLLNALMLGKLINNNLRIAMIWRRIEDWLNEFDKGNISSDINNKEVFDIKNLGDFLNNRYFDLTMKINEIARALKKSVNNIKKNEMVNIDLVNNLANKLNKPLEDILDNINKLKIDLNNKEIVDLLKNKSSNLNKLIEELFEASKAATGDMLLEVNEIEIIEFLKQAIIEFEDKIHNSTLIFRKNFPSETIYISCSSEKLWRVFDILLENAIKHSLENSRVYIDVNCKNDKVYICIKNTSKKELNIEPKDLIYIINSNNEEDVSGLGIEIAKNLILLQKGDFNISIDGDLFKVEIAFCINSIQEAPLEKRVTQCC
ncbi:sensor histidine kinase [Clostridium sp. D46t1_190503_E9]|uniref:sensor histidine kinase n=1 Tax=Clostridium sp. D46t1_190503_E9 TaxID=2787137 RepID=UPI00189BFF15|nr:sensor histidine kinase [Clostridium sp. D46t1_190503_E9]